MNKSQEITGLLTGIFLGFSLASIAEQNCLKNNINMNIDTTDFKRTLFDENHFKEYDIIIAMSELHRDYIKEKYNREISLFNEVYNGQKTAVNIGAPDSEDFVEQMKKWVHLFYEAAFSIMNNLEQIKGE
ncbi:hypothetical protein [Paenibacillus luteus]|uniref:hypothetical protein n=1 Tax=Paenibacillus luteus TaxID=2545753 RepID=UPI001141A65F|nr:hypothetical protein [Paenibacillus luteus]